MNKIRIRYARTISMPIQKPMLVKRRKKKEIIITKLWNSKLHHSKISFTHTNLAKVKWKMEMKWNCCLMVIC